MKEYQGRYFIRQRVWSCGDYIDIDTYPVFQRPGERRAKSKPTGEVQAALNQRDSELRFLRLVHTNFGPADYELDLTLGKPAEPGEAVRYLKAYFRRLRRRYRKAGQELRYVYVMERGKLSGRVHFHLIVNCGGMTRDDLEREWGLGYANTRRLQFDEHGVAALVEYVTKQGRKKQGKPEREQYHRRWSSSKNLIRPVPQIQDGKVKVPELQVLADAVCRRNAAEDIRQAWPGYELVEANAIRNAHNKGLYVRMSLCRRECWHGRPPKAMYSYGDIGEGPWEDTGAA